MSDIKFEARCPGDCHSGGWRDFDHYCDLAGIQPGEEGPAFAAWMNLLSLGEWDGDCGPVSRAERGGLS